MRGASLRGQMIETPVAGTYMKVYAMTMSFGLPWISGPWFTVQSAVGGHEIGWPAKSKFVTWSPPSFCDHESNCDVESQRTQWWSGTCRT